VGDGKIHPNLNNHSSSNCKLWKLNMRTILFKYTIPRLAFAKITGMFSSKGYLSPLGPLIYTEIPEPKFLGEDWTIVRTQLCGICGSDTKQVFLDADFDNPLTSLVSFPMVLGHEVVGVIDQIGPGVKTRQLGERVVLNPWLSCAPRGIKPLCPACQNGNYFLCENFQNGSLPTGMHTGNSSAATGGYAPFLPAHESMLFPIPNEISFDQAVLADPFSVSLHAVLKSPPLENGIALVYGCGTLGLLSIAILKSLYPRTEILVIARYPNQEKLAYELGASQVIIARRPTEIVESIAAKTNTPLQRPWQGIPWMMGGVDVIYDTVGSAETFEVGLRITRPRGSIVVTGVSRPKRFEWTPHYFKEINLIGSNAFGVESFEGQRMHGYEIYFQLLMDGRLKLPNLITHRFRQDRYRDALLASYDKGKYQAIKIVFDYSKT
jgi:threonine dehydrogenase-like Zn-dependent dehydrogenase